RGYLIANIRQSREMLSLSCELQKSEYWYEKWLSSVLTIYKHVARRVSEVYGFQEDIANGNIEEVFLNSPIASDLQDIYSRFVVLRSRYLTELERQCEIPNEMRWKEMVQEVENHGWLLHQFLCATNNLLATP